MESDNFTRHYIIRYLSAHELVLPPLDVVPTCPTMAVARTSERYFVLARSAIFKMIAALRRKGGEEEGRRRREEGKREEEGRVWGRKRRVEGINSTQNS